MKRRRIPPGYELVVFSSDLPDCKYCGDKWCPRHKKHYSECACIGPSEEASFKIIDGAFYAKRLDKPKKKSINRPRKPSRL